MGMTMRNKTGKLFQNIQTRKVSAYEYIKKNEYYAFVEMIQKQGNNQCIFTSDIMLKFMEHFLYEHNAKITAINLMVEDESLQEEILALLNKMDKQPAFWDRLKQKLLFLSEDNCIEIQSVDFKCSDDGFLISLMVNGLFTVTDDMEEELAMITQFVDCIDILEMDQELVDYSTEGHTQAETMDFLANKVGKKVLEEIQKE